MAHSARVLGVRQNSPVEELFTPANGGGTEDPSVYSVTPSIGASNLTGSVTITGYAFRSGAGVKFGGTDATDVTVVSSTVITCTYPNHAAGAVDVKVTNSDTTNGTLVGGFTYATKGVQPDKGSFVLTGESIGFGGFSPADLSLTGWWRNWTSGNWVGEASAGNSGSHNLTVGNAPGTTTLNGFSVADLDGTNDNFTGTSVTTYTGAGSYSIGLLISVDTDAAAATQIWDDRAILSDSVGNWAVVTRDSSGTHRVSHMADGTSANAENATISLTTWTFVQLRTDGSKIYSRVNSGSWSAGHTYGGNAASGNMLVGLNYANTAHYDGKIAEIFIADSQLADADFDNLKAYLNDRYALSL